MDELADLEAPIGAAAVPMLPPAGRCLWPLGEPGDDAFRWCGSKAAPGKPYCRAHIDAAHEKWSRRRR